MNDMQQNKNLVFTSAGDNTYFHKYWLYNNQNVIQKNFDICIYYYGNNRTNRYSEYADFYKKRKGSKMQNFYDFYLNNKDILEKYDYFFIMDDDIEISMESINKMFEIANKSNLWLCQPSLTFDSKCTYWFCKHNPSRKILYTNFCEINAPLLNNFAMRKLLDKYDPILVGWGIDLMLSQILSKQPDYSKEKIAIINEVTCKNPFENMKQFNRREIDNLQASKLRYKNWKDFAIANGYDPSFKVIQIWNKSFRDKRRIPMRRRNFVIDNPNVSISEIKTVNYKRRYVPRINKTNLDIL